MKTVDLTRYYMDDKATLGVLTIQGMQDPIFYTVERPWLNNEPNVSCIPQGVYECHIRQSPKNGEVYQLKDVQDRSHIQIHVGNTADQVEGCIAIGMSSGYVEKENKGVLNSIRANSDFKRIMNKEPFILNIL